jgi:nucleotide-binding universal stress UspA family protein
VGGTVVCDVTDPLAGQHAAEFASALGARLGLRLVLVYVVERELSPPEEGVTARRRSGMPSLDSIAQQLGHEAELRLVVGRPAEALARVAAEEGADLVVVGARPAGFGGRHLRCTLARELEAATPVPVLVAPPSTRRRSDRRLAVPADAASR